jgi:hypothetical protein
MDALKTRLQALQRLVTQISIKVTYTNDWVEVCTQLPNEMYLVGDANLDGEITQDDVSAGMRIISGSIDGTIPKILSDVNMDGVLGSPDISLLMSTTRGTATPYITYATAIEYADAAVGDTVWVYLADSSGHIYPAYAKVWADGIIAVYSNEQIPTTATGVIKIIKV